MTANHTGFDDLLLEGETILWSGEPDIDSAGPLAGSRTRRNATWVLIGSIIFLTVFFGAGRFFPIQVPAFAEGVLAILIPAAIFATILCVLFLFFVRVTNPTGERYALTNYRILAAGPDGRFTASLFAGGIGASYVVRNGSVHDIFFYQSGSSDDHVIGWFAIHNANAVEKLVTETLQRPSKDGLGNAQSQPSESKP